VDEESLANKIFQFGEAFLEAHCRALVQARRTSRLSTTKQVADIVVTRSRTAGISGSTRRREHFGALRIWVNRELEDLDGFLATAVRRLMAGARLAVISFHSLEDRIVKHAFRALARAEAALRILTKRPIEPGDEEVNRNPRARSAKLRAIERLA
jgi:16S rRNA (cytosine1402-N4)-methyltransferase